MFHTEDGGATWIKSNTLPNGWTPFIFVDYYTGFAFVGDSIIKTIDAGITWSKPKYANLNGFITYTSAGKDSILLLGNSLKISVDRGETWQELYPNLSNTVFPDCMAFGDSKHGWIMGRQQNFPPNQSLNGAGLTITADGGNHGA